jgi:hypothetical protein
MLSIISGHFIYFYSQNHYAEGLYAECRYAEYCGAFVTYKPMTRCVFFNVKLSRIKISARWHNLTQIKLSL